MDLTDRSFIPLSMIFPPASVGGLTVFKGGYLSTAPAPYGDPETALYAASDIASLMLESGVAGPSWCVLRSDEKWHFVSANNAANDGYFPIAVRQVDLKDTSRDTLDATWRVVGTLWRDVDALKYVNSASATKTLLTTDGSAAGLTGMPGATRVPATLATGNYIQPASFAAIHANFKVTLPTAGTYILVAVLSGYVAAATHFVVAQLYDVTNAAFIGTSQTLFDAGAAARGSIMLYAIITVAGATVISAYGKSDDGVNGYILADVNGGGSLDAFRIA